MQELQSQLLKRKTMATIDFSSLNNCICCYAHIINICSAHIIASVTSSKKRHLSGLGIPADGSSDGLDDDSDDEGDGNPAHSIDKLELAAECYNDQGNSNLRRWFSGLKHDPLKHAQRIIRLIRSSDQCRQGFQDYIKDGNKRSWFVAKGKDGDRTTIPVLQVELLRDMKTRWDSVYLMLQRLRQLRPVSLSQQLTLEVH